MASLRPAVNGKPAHACTSHLIESLKRELRARGYTYVDIAEALGLSLATVKRCFAERSFTLDRLAEICEVIELSFFELARLADADADRPTQLTLAQETALANDPGLLSVFHRLLSGLSVAQIMAADKIGEDWLVAALLRLDKLNLIRLMPGNRVRLATARTIEWRRDGPVRRWFANVIQNEFLSLDPDGEAVWDFAGGRLSAASRKQVQKRFEALMREIRELMIGDSALPASETDTTGIFVVCHPTPFSIPLRPTV